MKKVFSPIYIAIFVMCTNVFAADVANNSKVLQVVEAKPKLLFLAGSARKDSFNKMLAKKAYEIAKAAGADATFIDLKDFPMPIYDGDLEDAHGLPPKALELKKIFKEHDAVFIATPEYNGSIPPLLKNSLDWISRSSEKNEEPQSAFENKTIALGSVSPGSRGGKGGLLALQSMLKGIGVNVLGKNISIGKANDKFKNGHLVDKDELKKLDKIVTYFMIHAKK